MPKVLLVEYHEPTMLITKTLLTSHGYEVDTAINGKEALEKARENVPQVILSDVFMPVMDGYTLCKEVKNDDGLKHVPFILCSTTFIKDKNKRFGLDLGAEAYLIKTQEPEHFIEDLNGALDNFFVVPPHPTSAPTEIEEVFRKEYRQALLSKLQDKISQLEKSNRKLADKKNRQSQAQYSHFIESLGADYFIYSHGIDGVFTDLSPSITEMLGYTPDEFQAHYTQYMTDSLNNKEVERYTDTVIRGEAQPAYEVEVFHKNGSVRTLEVNESPVLDKKGTVVSIEGIAHDITEKKKIQENLEKLVAERTAEIQESERLGTALKKSEAKFQDLYDNAPDMFVSVDAKTAAIIECNQTLAKVLGYSKEELLGKPIFIVYHPDCMAEVKKVFQSFVQTGEVHNAFLQLKGKDDSKIDVILNATSVRDEQGNILHSRSSWRDISDLKKTEAALSRSEEQTRLLLDSTAEAIYGVDLNGECTFVNRACLEMLGYDDESIMLGTNMHELTHHKHSDGSGYPLEECRIFGSFREGERTHADDEIFWRADGTSFPVEFWAYPIVEQEKVVGSVVTFIDISKRKKVAEELARHKDHLEVIVEKRTAELQGKMDELELFNQLVIGREERMINLKEEINNLLLKLGGEEKYVISK